AGRGSFFEPELQGNGQPLRGGQPIAVRLEQADASFVGPNGYSRSSDRGDSAKRSFRVSRKRVARQSQRSLVCIVVHCPPRSCRFWHRCERCPSVSAPFLSPFCLVLACDLSHSMWHGRG